MLDKAKFLTMVHNLVQQDAETLTEPLNTFCADPANDDFLDELQGIVDKYADTNSGLKNSLPHLAAWLLTGVVELKETN